MHNAGTMATLLAAFALTTIANSVAAQDTDSRFNSLRLTEDETKGILWSEADFEAARGFPGPVVTEAEIDAAPKGTIDRQTPAANGRASVDGQTDMKGLPAPEKWMGKLFFRDPGGDSYCSAQFVAPDVVLTAAHCVQSDAGVYFRDFVFALQYNKGKSLSLHRARCVAAFDQYSAVGNFPAEWDYAMILVDRQSSVGHFGVMAPYQGQKGLLLGYPGKIQKGEALSKVKAILEGFDGLMIQSAEHGNKNFTEGSSGGAWVYNPSTQAGDDTNLIVGITRGGLPQDPVWVMGPTMEFFGDLFDHVSGGC